MKKSLFIVPMVLLIAGGCSDDTEPAVKEPVVEQERRTEDSKVVEKEVVTEKTPVVPVKEPVKEPIPKNDTNAKQEPNEVTPVTSGGTDGEPMDDISDEIIISPNEKVGYITKIEKNDTGSQLTVDFAEMVIDDSHDVGFYIENKKVGKDKVTANGNVQAFALNGNKLVVSTVGELASKKGTLFTFLYTDAGELFMIEEKYLP